MYTNFVCNYTVISSTRLKADTVLIDYYSRFLIYTKKSIKEE